MTSRRVRVMIPMLLLVVLAATQAIAQVGTPVYNNIPTPLPPNVPSLGYQATATSEWGDEIVLGGTARRAASATITMSDWAKHSNYPTMPAAGFTHPITLNIYTVNHSNPIPAPGVKIGTITQSFLIPWRPEANPLCTGDRWMGNDSQCYSGYAFKITFDLRSLGLTLPNDMIFGVAYNTNTWGYNPIGLPGPYESLNVGCANANGVGVPSTVGYDADADATMWNTAIAGFYTDGGAGGVGIFRQDTGWTDSDPAVQFNAYTVANNKDACKDGGWQSLSRADASPFKNQGDCIQYVNTGK